MGTWSCLELCHKERSAERLYSLRTKHQLRSGVRPTTAVPVSRWPWSWNCTEILHQTLIGAQIFLLTFLSKIHTSRIGLNANSCNTACSIRNILDVKKEVPGFIICLLDHDDHVMIGFMVLGIWMRCRNVCVSLRQRSTSAQEPKDGGCFMPS